MQELQEQIGFSAGQIYDYLSNNGEATFSKMKKELDLKGNFADLGLGWLAREDKIEISKRCYSGRVRLKYVSFDIYKKIAVHEGCFFVMFC